jgi:hypothetical protein
MMHYIFEHGLYKFVDNDGMILNEEEEIAIIIDLEMGIMLRHGNPELVENNYKAMKHKYRFNGMDDIADKLILITGRFPIEELNKIISISGYARLFLEKLRRSTPNAIDLRSV